MDTTKIDRELWTLNEQLPEDTGLLAIVDHPPEGRPLTKSYRFADGVVCSSPGAALEHLTDLVREHEAE